MKRYLPNLFLLISILIFFTDTLQKLPYSPDDTFIYMQYARNIASGGGFSFNYAEPSYGVTSPFWVLILSIPATLGFNTLLFSKLLDILSVIFAVLVFYKISDLIYQGEDSRFLRSLSTSIFLLNIWVIRWAFTGMETNFGLLCTLAIFFCYLTGKFKTVFILFGLFFLIRPESSVLFLVIYIFLIFRRRSLQLKYSSLIVYLLLYTIVIAPFLIYFYSSCGTMFPNTLLGKSTLTFSFHTIIFQLRAIISTIAPASIIEIILSFIFLLYLIRKKQLGDYLIFFIWPAAFILLYVVTDADIISRYFIPILPFFTLLGIKSIELLKKNRIALAIVLFIVILFQSQFLFYKYIKPGTDNFAKGVNECFIPIGKWFNSNTPPGTRILVNDVGAIGYYSQRYIIDAAALVNRDLELNKKIMQTPVEERTNTVNLLKFIQADYLVERDTTPVNSLYSMGSYKLDFLFEKEFPGLALSDTRTKYYKVYKVIKEM